MFLSPLNPTCIQIQKDNDESWSSLAAVSPTDGSSTSTRNDEDDDDDDDGLQPSRTPTQPTRPFRSRKRSLVWLFSFFFFVLVWNVLLFFLLAAVAVTHWMWYLTDQYWEPHLATLAMTPTRQLREWTNYYRECTVDDVTTRNPFDLLLPFETRSRQPARHQKPRQDHTKYYEHHLHHGFSVIPGVLSDTMVQDLYDHVQTEHERIGPSSHIFVMQGSDHRSSFALDPTVPLVAHTMKQLSQHAQLEYVWYCS